MPENEGATNPEGRVANIEHKLAVMDYRMSSNESLLKEIADAVKQLVVLTQEQKALQDDLHDLRGDFNERKKTTDPVIQNAERVIGKVYGGALVFTLFFGIFAWIGSTNIAKIDLIAEQSKENKTQILLIEKEIENHNSQFEIRK